MNDEIRKQMNKAAYSQVCDICSKNEGLDTKAIFIQGHMISPIQPLAYSLCKKHHDQAIDILYKNEQIFFENVKSQIAALK